MSQDPIPFGFVLSCWSFLLIRHMPFPLNLFIFLSQSVCQESNDDALHFDAHVTDIQRKQHDIRGCRCVFHVQYIHDQSQVFEISWVLVSSGMSCIKPIFNHLVMQCVYSFFFSVVINSNAHVYRPNVA
jgi:hypothetical protein